MTDNCTILAGIVTYNPDLDKFTECLEAVLKQIDNVYIFDNASQNIDQIQLLLKKYESQVILYKNSCNDGIATALHNIMEFASTNHYDWVLALDQDSVLQPGIINYYRKAINKCPLAGMFTCQRTDRNFHENIDNSSKKAITKVPCCITSGSLTKVKAYNETSGYDKSFFIDAVDFDFCFTLREKGYKIYRINRIGLLHEVGHGENRRFLFKNIIIFNENPTRIYYMTRNKFKLFKKHQEYSLPNLIYRECELFFRLCLYEKDKTKKLKMFFKGLLDGITAS
ncbi:MAG: glycosyltransferase family 2 protein [Lachnospiraceae bacterium]|nr:glycosyltransferase family 2 protein [Lachnospiraceae bacterium]